MPGLRPHSFAVFALAAVLLGGCVSTGVRSIAFITPELSDSYIPLYMGTRIGSSRFAAAVVIAPNVAVTNDHNLNLLSPDMVIARSPAYDLLFFRTRTRARGQDHEPQGRANRHRLWPGRPEPAARSQRNRSGARCARAADLHGLSRTPDRHLRRRSGRGLLRRACCRRGIGCRGRDHRWLSRRCSRGWWPAHVRASISTS